MVSQKCESTDHIKIERANHRARGKDKDGLRKQLVKKGNYLNLNYATSIHDYETIPEC